MAHEIAKLLLEQADTFLNRTQAVQAAMDLGMPLHAIRDYLDWLDAIRGSQAWRPADREHPSESRDGR